ncbi:MAG: amidophosphoribosyltransferase [Desulforegulaceae bacterium]|nr:amidophosphoribosyltransferase [Desulforegulaceae bacterium]
MGGIFGCALKHDCIIDLFYGTDYLSHLGTRKGGLAVKGAKGFRRKIHSLESSYFRTKFESGLHEFEGNTGIGVISDYENQPIMLSSSLGVFAIVSVSRIKNIDELAKRAYQKNRSFSEISSIGINPSEIIAMMISEKGSFEEGIAHALESVEGSSTIIVLTDNCLYAARDRLGRTPLIIGKKDNGLAVSSETSAFPNLDYKVEKELGPGEIVKITSEGYEQVKPPGDKMQICSFLWVYYGYPASSYEGINVESVRYECGKALARRETTDIDCVSGIPDSGIGHGLGYANEKGISYIRSFVKYTPTWPRSFIPQNQNLRELVAKMKLIPVKELINGKRLLFCEDSVVRGTQLKGNVQMLYDYGALEVHMRVACPTIIYPCEFLNFSQSRSTLDLAGRKAIQAIEGKEDANLEQYSVSGSEKNLAMIEVIRQKLGLTTLKYQSLDDLVSSIGLPKEKLCTHCFDGTGCFR